jgi:hypothetical protein
MDHMYKSKSIDEEKQLSLFDDLEQSPRNAMLLDYEEWECIVTNYIWNRWHVKLEEAVNEFYWVNEDFLRVAHQDGMTPREFAHELAADCDWKDVESWP